jgi:phenylacetic acid degradation operon negative regulatory protein
MEEQLRRRSVGAPAARSILLTLLGEYVLPLSSGVWQETLVKALETLDYKTQAARQALARSVSGGWLETERHGRRSRLRLAPETRQMLRSGAERIYSFGDPWEWDGRWLLVVLRVPEHSRDVRHQVRTQLAWAGFGSLGGGLWISPHVEREPQVREVVAGNGAVAELLSFHAELGEIGDPDRVIAEAWDLEALAQQYKDFIGGYGRSRPRKPEEVFRAQTQMVHDWRKFPFLDPDLPDHMLPDRWPRKRAHDLFKERHAEWGDQAQAYFRSLEEG